MNSGSFMSSCVTVLVKHGPHVPGLRARERAKPALEKWTFEHVSRIPHSHFSRVKGPCLTGTVIPFTSFLDVTQRFASP